jgi:hypothetical protein
MSRSPDGHRGVSLNSFLSQRSAHNVLGHIYDSPSFYKFRSNPDLIHALSVIMSVIVPVIVIRLKHGPILLT